MTQLRAIWPPEWDNTLEALCHFYGIRAHAASKSVVLLLTGQGEPFAQVPSESNLAQLRFAIPLLLDAFELGTRNGEARIKARMRELLRGDESLGIPSESGEEVGVTTRAAAETLRKDPTIVR